MFSSGAFGSSLPTFSQYTAFPQSAGFGSVSPVGAFGSVSPSYGCPVGFNGTTLGFGETTGFSTAGLCNGFPGNFAAQYPETTSALPAGFSVPPTFPDAEFQGLLPPQTNPVEMPHHFTTNLPDSAPPQLGTEEGHEHEGDHFRGCGHDFMTLGYWKIRGLAAPIRMLLAFAGCDYEETMFGFQKDADGTWDRSEWLSKKEELKEDNPLINLPYYIDGAIVLAQSNAILKHIGRKFKLIGCHEIDAAKSDMLMDQAFDLRSAFVRLCYMSEDFETDKQAYLETTLMDNLQKFEAWLEAQECRFLVEDDHPTTPDFVLWELLDVHRALFSNALDNFPMLQEFYRNFRELPQLQNYFESELYQLPINGPMAHFY